jgi:alcohol dehydrogenase class IV
MSVSLADLAQWSFPTRIVFGLGAAETVGELANASKMRRVLLVTDGGVRAAGLDVQVRASLERAGIAVATFDGVGANPTEAQIEAGTLVFREHGADGLVALGGGSPMDAAKLIGVRARTHRPFEELDDAVNGGVHIPLDVPPLITLPTTAGTGSEVGRSGVLTVRSTGRKTVIFAPQLLAKTAILDPALTLSLPPKVTAATGFDALTHCIEAFLAKGDHPLADAIALHGIELIQRHLRTATHDGSNVEARGGMLKAAMMGAVAFQKGLGACHSLAHPLSAQHGTHHGLANALCLPPVLRFNQAVVPDKVRRVAELLGARGEADAAAVVGAFRREVGLPAGLRAAGIDESHLPALARDAIADACHLSNPRACSEADLLALYREAL